MSEGVPDKGNTKFLVRLSNLNIRQSTGFQRAVGALVLERQGLFFTAGIVDEAHGWCERPRVLNRPNPRGFFGHFAQSTLVRGRFPPVAVHTLLPISPYGRGYHKDPLRRR